MNNHTIEVDNAPASISGPDDLIGIVSSIGCASFSEALLGIVDQLVGADYCACYRQRDYRLDEVASAAQPDCRISQSVRTNVHEVKRHLAKAGAALRIDHIHSHLPKNGAEGPDSAENGFETVLIYARFNRLGICIKLLRHSDRGGLDTDRRFELERAAALLLAITYRHIELFDQQSDLTPSLSTLETIEYCIQNMSDLPRREREVCSRILHGLSSHEIAERLGIGKESVMTYRKRAYSRLDISSQRELLMWYLDIWKAAMSASMRSSEREPEAA